ncbi:hypothetical protein BH11ARM1_BH11ARM1_03250 [soil metagenome]
MTERSRRKFKMNSIQKDENVMAQIVEAYNAPDEDETP